MSLRKSRRLSPQLVAANRRNAQVSTGPRTPATQQNSNLNAMKHGGRAGPENHRRQETAGATFDASQGDMLNVPESESADPGVLQRKEFPGGNLPASAHDQGSDADMENIGKTVEMDIPSGTPATE